MPSASDLWRSTFDLYHPGDAEADVMRAHHVSTVLRLAPALMVANLFNAAVIAVVFGGRQPWLMAGWGLLLGLSLLATARAWWRWRARGLERVSPRTLRRAAMQAGLLAAVWGLVPLLWLDAASAAEQVMLACVVTGMMAGGALVLVSLPLSALAYVAVLALCCLGALLRHHEPLMALTALLVLSYAATLVLGAMSGARKATALLRAQFDSARQRRIVSVLLHDFESHAAEALWQTDVEGGLTRVSPRLAELLGGDETQLPGARLLELLAARSADAALALERALAEGRPFQGLQLAVGDGASARWWAMAGKPLFDDAGRADGWRGVIADISDEVQARQRLSYLAHHDALTGLANRLQLNERVRQHLQSGRSGALLVIDLDHFKAVNDSLGHATGDALLRVVALRLSASTRPSDTVARLGGDEFGALLTTACGEQESLQLAQRIVAALNEPCDVQGRTLRVGASVGVALLPEHGNEAQDLLGHADMALYEAKAQGRNCAVLYASTMGDRSRRRVELEHGLRQALAQGHLALHWQPQVDLASGSIVGAEALARWVHPRFGPVGPSEFIVVAEQCGLIHPLGRWVLDEACRNASRHLPGLQIAVNVSAAQLRDEGFVGWVRQALQVHGIEPQRLELEITESLLIDDDAGAFERLHSLHALGVRIALDDFGTGYSSLAYLRRFPFSTLKIDRAFVGELMERGDAQAIVRTITQLAVALGMRTVAEGVETVSQLAVVRETGCEQAQGHLFAPACAAEAFATLQARWQPVPQQDGLH